MAALATLCRPVLAQPMVIVKTSPGGMTATALLMIVVGTQRTIDAPLTEAVTRMVVSQLKMPVAHAEAAAVQRLGQQVSTLQWNLPKQDQEEVLDQQEEVLDQQEMVVEQLGALVVDVVDAEQQAARPVCQLDQEVDQEVAAAMGCVQMIPWGGMILMAPCIIVAGTVEGSMLANGMETDMQTWAGRRIKPAAPVEGGVLNFTLQVARVLTLSLKSTSAAAAAHTNRSLGPLKMVRTMQLTTSPSARI